jgi:hypothetical protein
MSSKHWPWQTNFQCRRLAEAGEGVLLPWVLLRSAHQPVIVTRIERYGMFAVDLEADP